MNYKTITIEEAIRHPNFLSCTIEGGYEETSPYQMVAPRRTKLYKVRFKCDRIFREDTRYCYEYRNIFGDIINTPEYHVYINADTYPSHLPVFAFKGRNFYDGDQYFCVDKKHFTIYNFTARVGHKTHNTYEYFFTKADADKYIADNKPKYSEKEFKAASESEYKKGRTDERRNLTRADFDMYRNYTQRPLTPYECVKIFSDHYGYDCKYDEHCYTIICGDINVYKAHEIITQGLPLFKYRIGADQYLKR